jgi:GTP-binding protein
MTPLPMATPLPRVAIVGRPNVGKSSLFNRFVERRESLVHDQPGVTRDRIYGDAEWEGKPFTVIDTGGLEPGAEEPLKNLVERQVKFAIQEARVILFVVDGKQGIVALDEYIAKMLHKTGKPVLVAVNKIDIPDKAPLVADFYKLGFGEPIWASAQHGTHVDAVLDELFRQFDKAPDAEAVPMTGLKIGFAGKPNAGKSTLVNTLVRQERLLVHHEPGTTRDAVFVPFTYEGKPFVLVDTAGVRRKARITNAVEKLAIIQTQKALDKLDVAVLVLDAERRLDTQDKRVAGLIQEANKPCVVAVNKWDTVEDKRHEKTRWEKQLVEELYFLRFCPRVYMSGLKGQNVGAVLKAAQMVDENSRLHYPANKLTAMVKEAAIIHSPPSKQGRKLTVYYVAQLKNKMATFVFKVNDRDLVHFSYERYLENLFRQTLGFEGIPLKFVWQDKSRSRTAANR